MLINSVNYVTINCIIVIIILIVLLLVKTNEYRVLYYIFLVNVKHSIQIRYDSNNNNDVSRAIFT